MISVFFLIFDAWAKRSMNGTVSPKVETEGH